MDAPPPWSTATWLVVGGREWTGGGRPRAPDATSFPVLDSPCGRAAAPSTKWGERRRYPEGAPGERREEEEVHEVSERHRGWPWRGTPRPPQAYPVTAAPLAPRREGPRFPQGLPGTPGTPHPSRPGPCGPGSEEVRDGSPRPNDRRHAPEARHGPPEVPPTSLEPPPSAPRPRAGPRPLSILGVPPWRPIPGVHW